MRVAIAVGLVLFSAWHGFAQCPPSCFGGGGPATTDCFLSWGGVTSPSVTCTDGDPACDTDGQIDGQCTFAATACVNVSSGSCTSSALDAAPTVAVKGTGAQALAAAIRSLPTSGTVCTEGGLAVVPVTITPAKLKPGVVTLKTTTVSGGKKDKDKLRLVCQPARPTLAANVQPIFTQTCTYAGCHSGLAPQSALSLEEGQTLAGLVNQRALAFGKLVRVKPGSLKKSYLTRSTLGLNAREMPDGCPSVLAPVERCLTDVEKYVLLAWIQAGALP